jgi:adenylate cyclase class 2
VNVSSRVRDARETPSKRLSDGRGTGVCVDEVEHAGWFVEFEKVVGPGRSGTQVQVELDRLARSLGVALERVTDTYDSLVRAALAPMPAF